MTDMSGSVLILSLLNGKSTKVMMASFMWATLYKAEIEIFDNEFFWHLMNREGAKQPFIVLKFFMACYRTLAWNCFGLKIKQSSLREISHFSIIFPFSFSCRLETIDSKIFPVKGSRLVTWILNKRFYWWTKLAFAPSIMYDRQCRSLVCL